MGNTIVKRSIVTWILTLAILVAALVQRAQADSFGVNPLNVEMPAGARNASVTITNDDPDMHVMQTQLYVWNQQNGIDKLEPASDALISPPIFTLQAQLMQQIRIAMLHRPSGDKETCYRLVATEVPSQLKSRFGATVAMQLSIPVFIAPVDPAPQPPAFAAENVGSKSATIVASNQGNVHVKFAQLELRSGDRVLYRDRGLHYLLAGQTLRLPVKLEHPVDGALHVVYYTDGRVRNDARVSVR